jgi:hypothetical protein
MPRPTTPVEFNADGYPMMPRIPADVPFGTAFDALVARDFLGLQLRRHATGMKSWIYQAASKDPIDAGGCRFGHFHDVPPWSVSGDEALYLLDFVSDFEIGTTANGVRCSLWLSYQHPTWPDTTEVDGYGEAALDEFGTTEEWQQHQRKIMGYGPPLGLAICRAVYQATLELNDVMLELHLANVRKVLGLQGAT